MHLPPLRDRPRRHPAARRAASCARSARRTAATRSRSVAAALRWLAGAAVAREHPPAAADDRARGARGRRTTCSSAATSRGPAAMEPAGSRRGPAAAGRQHDARRDRAGDDREVAAAPRAATSRRVAESLGLSRAGPLPAAREVRDHARERPRAGSSLAYLVVAPRTCSRGSAVARAARAPRSGCSPSEPAARVSLLVGLAVARRACVGPSTAATSAALLAESDFTTRASRGGPARDGPPGRRLQPDGRRLRDERTRDAGAALLLASVLGASPSRRRHARLRRPLDAREPRGRCGSSVRRAADAPSAGARRGRLTAGRRPWPALAPGDAAVVPLQPGAARPAAPRRVHRPRLRAPLPAARGADRGAAAVGAGRLREAHPHDVARGQQLGRRRRARCWSRACIYAGGLPGADRADFEQALSASRSRGWAAARVHARLRRRRAAAAARLAAVRSPGWWRGRRDPAAGPGRAARRRLVRRPRGPAAAGPRRPRPDRAGARQHGQERDRGRRRRAARSSRGCARGGGPGRSSWSRTPGRASRPRRGAAVHAVLHHQGRRPGHRPDPGAGDPGASTAATSRWRAPPAARRVSR